VAASAAVIAFFPLEKAGDPKRKGPLSVGRSASPQPAAAPADGAGSFKPSESVEELQTLDLPRVTKLVSRALVVLDLRTDDDRPLREERGVIVDSGGVVLCRFHPLLGAHHGTCKLALSQEARVEIAGLAYREETLDLALLRIASSPVGYPMVPLLADPPSQVLQPADLLYVFSDYNALEANVAESYYPCSDGVTRLRLSEKPPVPPEAFLAVDSYGFLLGLCRVEAGIARSAAEEKSRAGSAPRDYRMLIDPASSLAKEVDRDATLSLYELTRRLYEGTFADYFSRASAAFKQKRWAEAFDLFEQALGRVSSDRPDDEDVEKVMANLRESYFEEIQRLSGANRTDEVVSLSQAALRRYPDDATFMVLLAEASFAQRNWVGGIQALVEARGISPTSRIDSLLEGGYLQLAAEASQAGDVRRVEASLLEGIQQLPASGNLNLELAKLYHRLGAYDDAIRLLQRVKEVAPLLRETAESLLAKIDDFLKKRDSIIIPIPTGSRSIRTEAVVDGARQYSFIIDTGATYTTIPEGLARTLGYDTSKAKHVQVMTVGGQLSVPTIQVESVSLGGYLVRNLEVLVIPENVGPESGLLGLNFLKHFKYSVDASRNEFRLERP
jgi:clan AA aspartic protease (TIGR02281 family)